MKKQRRNSVLNAYLTNLWSKYGKVSVLFVVSVLVVALTGVFTITRGGANAATTSNLNFQARLLQSSGSLVADGTYNVQFNLYTVASGGSTQWTETYLNTTTPVTIKDGYMSVSLGSLTAFPGTIDWDQEQWLGMTVRGTGSCAFGACTPADAEMTPRFKLTAVPYAFKSAVSANVQSAATNAGSTNSSGVSVVSGNATGATSNSGSITIDSGTATGTAGALLFGTTNASALTIGRAGVTTTLQGSISLTGAGIGLAVTNNATVGGTLAVTSTSTFTGLLTANGGVTVATGNTFTNASSTLFTALAISNVAGGGNIGSAATTVDVATTFNVTQTTASQTLTLPTPTVTTAGRIAYVNNIGSTPFTMHGSVVNNGGASSFIWNGTTWVTNLSLNSSVVTGIGAIDSQTKSANGAVIASNAIVLQTADATNVGLVSTGIQTLAGAKTFSSLITGSAGLTVTGADVNLNASSNFNTNINTGTSTGAVSIGNSLAGAISLQSASSIGLTGATTINGPAGPGTTALTVNVAATGNSGLLINSPSGYGSGYYARAYSADAGYNVFSIDNFGQTIFRPASDNAGIFGIQNAAGQGLFYVNSTTAEVTLPNASLGVTYSISGANLTLTSGGGSASFTTPQGSSVGTKINIQLFDPGGFNQILALGLPNTSGSTSRVISLFDNRSAGDNQPALSVFTPNESDVFGLSSDGSNSYGYLKSTSGIGLGFKVGSNVAAQIDTSGNFTFNNNTTIGNATTDRLTLTSQLLGASPLVFQGATDDAYTTTFAVTDPTANNTITLPNASGTVCLQGSSSCGFTASSLTDNIADSLDIQEGTNNYININTTNASENISFGNATTNPSYNFLGSGTLTVAGPATVNGLLTATLGATVSGATTNINVSSNFATNINTGTSSGAVSIGNSLAGAIALQSASTIGLTGTTTITGLGGGSSKALVVNNSTSTGNIFEAQDNGTAVLTVADGGAVLLQNTADSANAFQIKDAGGGGIFNVDTSGVYAEVKIGGSKANSDLVFVGGGVDQWEIGSDQSGLGGANSFYLWNPTTTAYVLGVSTIGQATFKNSTNSTAAFTVQNTSGSSILNVDTTNGEVELGNATTAGKIVVSDGSSNTVTLIASATSGDYSLSIPTLTANDTICVQGVNNCGYIASALTDNITNALDLQEGTNNYVNINTTNSSENISFGNATTNPSYNLLGSGRLTVGSALTNLGAKLAIVGTADEEQLLIRANATQSSSQPIIKVESSAGTELFRLNYKGTRNLGLGLNTLDVLSSGYDNSAFGDTAGAALTTGYENTLFGSGSGDAIAGGFWNTSVGTSALSVAVSSQSNTAIGAYSQERGTGSWNTSIGQSALQYNVSGADNVAIGANAGLGVTTASNISNSVLIGSSAGIALRTGGNNNILIGFQAGDALTTGSDNIIIGYNVDASAAGVSNQLRIGNGSNILLQGDTSTLALTANGALTSVGLLTGNLGLTVSGAAISLNDNSNFATTINTGTSTGAVTIGNASNAANTVTVVAGATNGINLNAPKLVTNAATLSLFDTNATTATLLQAGTSISIGATTGTLTVRNANQTFGNAAGSGVFTNNGATLNSTLQLADIAAGGAIGTAAATVDVYTSIAVLQTTAGRTLTIPTPTSNPTTVFGRTIYLSNIGTTSFTLGSTTVNPGTTATLIWSNTDGAATGGESWQFAGADGNGILNQNTADQTANFRISGTGRANTSFTTPLVDSITGALSIGTNTATGLTIGGTTNTTSIVLQGAVASTYTVGTATGTGIITIGQAASSTQIVNLQAANGTASTQTVNIATGTSTTSGGKVVNIATGVPGAGTTNTIAIGNGGAATGTVGVTIGSIGAAAHTTLIQGGNGATAVSIQSAASSTILIGTTNASTLSIGKQGSAATFNGNLIVGASAGSGTTLTNNGATLNTTLQIADIAAGGAIGTAAATVDIYTSIAVLQTTAGRTLTIPTPTSNPTTVFGRIIYVANIGTTNFILGGATINPGTTATLVWSNTDGAATTGESWQFAGADGNGILNQNSADQTANFRISGTGRANTSFTTPLVDSITGALSIGTSTATGVTIGNATNNSGITIDSGTGAISIGTGAQARTTNIATGGAAQTVTLGSTNTTSSLTLAAGSGAITFNASQAQFSEVTGTRTLTVQTRTTNVAGSALTISGGTAGAGAAAFSGGLLTLQGGGAGGTGNANGGGVTISGGASAGTGTQGLVSLSSTVFSTAPIQTFASSGVTATTAGYVDSYSTLPITASTTGAIDTLTDPGQTTIGRIIYVAARSGSNDITLRLNSARTPIDITLKANSTATLIWNGTDWTAAGASSSTDLQAAYNNTATSAGAAELILNASGGAADGLTVRNNATNPIIGGIFEAQTSVGSNIFSVNNNATEYAVNGGAETSTNYSTNWLAAPAGGTVTRNTANAATTVATGLASTSVVTTATAAHGARNLLSSALTYNLKYNVSYTVRADSATASFSTLETMYSSDGTATAGNVRACVAGTPTYFTGTASQSTTTITGVGTTWTAGMVGQIFVFANGASALVTGFTSATVLTTSASYSQTVASQGYNMYTAGNTVKAGAWSRVSCTFTAPASGTLTNNSIFIRQTDATARTFYIDNLSVTVSADVNHAVDGSVDDSTNFATNWTQIGGATVARNTSNLYDTSASASVVTTATIGHGIRNNMTISPSVSTQYLVTFYAKSSNTFNDIRVRYSRDGGTNFASCADYNTQSVSTTAFTRITCLFTTDGSAPSNPDLIIDQPTATARTFYVDALSVTLNTNNSNNVQIGSANKGGPITLLTLDRAASAPIAANNDAYLGSMYYDTTSGRIQCYEADGWGACGSAPDNYVNLNPEYAGAVLNGSGVGTMNADFCANQVGVLVVGTLCSTGESRNFYRWTSPQNSPQTYSIYVSYQLPATFKGFASDDTVQLTGRTSSTTDGSVTYEMFKNESGVLTACGTATAVTTSNNTWQTVGINGNESTGCSFSTNSANAFVIFKINVTAQNNANVYVGTLGFTTTGR